MYTFLSLIGVIVTLTVLGTIPFIVDRNAPSVAHPPSESELETTSRTSLPASDESDPERPPERTSREQHVHSENPAREPAAEPQAEPSNEYATA